MELSLPISDAQLYGETDEHISWLDQATGIHQDMLDDWLKLASAAQTNGFELAIASGFRSIHRQQTIWANKLAGKVAVLGDAGEQIDISQYDAAIQNRLIMRWSALPGASRHHWGTDFDFYDKAAMPEGYQLQLTAAEYGMRGLFAPLCEWLEDYLQQADSPAFFFPYKQDHGGVGVEPWHLSYLPIAEQYQRLWRKMGCCQVLAKWQHSQSPVLISSIDALYDQFIKPTLMINHDN